MARKVRVKHRIIAKDKISDVEKLNGEIIFAKENDKITEALVGTNTGVLEMDTIMPLLKNANAPKKKGLITIMFDDGWLEDYTVIMPLAEQYGIRCNTALICSAVTGTSGNYMSPTQALELQNTYGWEMCCHTRTHAILIDPATDLESEIVESKNILEGLGFNIRSITYPENKYNDNVIEKVRQHYDYAMGIRSVGDAVIENDLYGYVINDTPINQYALYRSYMWNFDNVKALIDETIETGGWLILAGHGKDYKPGAEGAEASLAILEEIFSYLSTSYPDNVVTLSEAFDEKKNLYTYGDRSSNYYFMSKDGSVDSYSQHKFSRVVYKGNKADNDTPPSAFKNNCVTVNSYMGGYDADKGFPTTSGILTTYKFDARADLSELAYQEWHPNGSWKTEKYIRHRMYNNDTKTTYWGGWIESRYSKFKHDSSAVIANDTSPYDANIANQTMTWSTYTTAEATAAGFPNPKSGNLITLKDTDKSSATPTQIWMPCLSRSLFIRRHYNSEWQDWMEFSAIKCARFNDVVVPEIPAMSDGVPGTAYIDIPIADVNQRSAITVNCGSLTNVIDEDNVDYKAYAVADGAMRILFRNYSASAISSMTTHFEIIYSYFVPTN